MRPGRPAKALILLLPALLAAQEPLRSQGGGGISLDGRDYRFEPESLVASKPRQGQAQVFQVKGRFVPADPGRALDFRMIVLRSGQPYTLELVRRDKAGKELERWGASLKTRIQAQVPDKPKLGDKAVFTVSGPVAGAVDGQARSSAWTGSFWITFVGVPDAD